MCERVREKERGEIETEVESEGEEEEEVWLNTIGLDMNAPQHSFPHIPFNFNSLIEPAAPHPHIHRAQREETCWHTHAHACAVIERQTRSSHERVPITRRRL